MENDLRNLVGANEHIYWEGRPDKRCFLFESIFNPLLPIAIVWGIMDFGILGGTLFGDDIDGFTFIIIPFMLLHLMPVWLYLGGVLFTAIRYRNTYYIVTDRAIYASGGAFSKTFNTKPFQEMSHIDIHRGIFDQMFGVGDVIASTNQISSKGKPVGIEISSIENYTEVFNLVKKLQTDVFSDTMYPNDMRPPENHGYNTKYKG